MVRKNLPTAYVMNMGANGLAVARTLAREGVPVVGVDDRPEAPGFASRHVTRLLTDDIMKKPEGVVDSLLRAADGEDEKGVILPTSDAAVHFLSSNERALSERFRFLVPPERVRGAMVNKRLQYEEAIRLGIPVPETCFPTGPDDLREVEGTVRFPAFIKPLYSHRWNIVFANKGFVVRDPEELRERMTKVFASGQEVMVQTIMQPPGKGLFSAGAYFGQGEYVSPAFCWHKIRQYPPSFGVGSLVESAHQPEVRELALRFMKGMGYKGIGYVEFKRDSHDGIFKMVEMNARTGQTNALQAAAGIPLVLFMYNDLVGRPLPEVSDYPDGLRWWDSMNDAESFWRLKRRGEITFLQWARSISQVDVHAYYSWGDPMPLFRRYRYGGELAKMTYNLLKMKTDEDAVTPCDRVTDHAATHYAEHIKMDEARGGNREAL
jgi:D-aspartate ligase